MIEDIVSTEIESEDAPSPQLVEEGSAGATVRVSDKPLWVIGRDRPPFDGQERSRPDASGEATIDDGSGDVGDRSAERARRRCPLADRSLPPIIDLEHLEVVPRCVRKVRQHDVIGHRCEVVVPAAPAERNWRRDPGARCRTGHGRPRRQGFARRAFEDDDAAELDPLAGFEPDAVEQDLDRDDARVGLADERERMAGGVGRAEQALGMHEHRVGGHHLASVVAVSEHLASEPPRGIRTNWTGVVATRRAHGRP